jgi:hypothetical protein
MDTWRKRRAALAASERSERTPSGDERGRQQRVDLIETLLDHEDVVGALDEQVGAKAVAPNHLDGEAPDVPDLDLTAAPE